MKAVDKDDRKPITLFSCRFILLMQKYVKIVSTKTASVTHSVTVSTEIFQ